jgi:large-conductance mechanosensitive channel
MNTLKKIPKKSILILFFVISIIFYLLFYANSLEKELTKNLKKKKPNKKHGIFNTFLVKHTIIAGALAFLIGLNLRDVINSFVNALIDPIFNIDFDKDGVTDLKEIVNTISFSIFDIEFKFGPFLLNSLKFSIFLTVTYLIIIFIYLRTNLISIE